MARRPLLSLPSFRKAHIEQQEKLLRYVISGRGRRSFDAATWETLKEEAAWSFKTTSARARINFAAATKEALRDVSRASADRAFLVTLTPRSFALPLSEATDFDIAALIAWARDELAPLTFMAAVDVAYYSNWALPGVRERTFAWHVHALVWGTSQEVIDQLVGRINREHLSLVVGCPAAHARRLKSRTFIGRAMYMLKFPQSEYRVFPRTLDVADMETGEITKQKTGVMRQKKRQLRTGDAWRLTKLMKHLRLRDILFAGGDEGRRVLRAAARQVRRQARQDQHVRLLRLKRLEERHGVDSHSRDRSRRNLFGR